MRPVVGLRKFAIGQEEIVNWRVPRGRAPGDWSKDFCFFVGGEGEMSGAAVTYWAGEETKKWSSSFSSAVVLALLVGGRWRISTDLVGSRRGPSRRVRGRGAWLDRFRRTDLPPGELPFEGERCLRGGVGR